MISVQLDKKICNAMPDKFAAIDKVLGTQTDIVEVEESVKPIDRITDDLQKDYEYNPDLYLILLQFHKSGHSYLDFYRLKQLYFLTSVSPPQLFKFKIFERIKAEVAAR